MPSPTVMRKKSEKVDKAIGRVAPTKEEKEAAKKAKEESKGPEMSPWVLGLFMFVVIGSSFLQIITNIQTQPSMSDENL